MSTNDKHPPDALQDAEMVRQIWGSLEPKAPLLPLSPQPCFKEYSAYEDCGDPMTHIALEDIKSITDIICF